MTVLSLDLGTKLGSYVEDMTEAITFNLGKGDERFRKFDGVLGYNVRNLEAQGYTLDMIVYEGAAHQKGFAMPLYHGLVGVLKCFCEYNDIELVAIHAMTVKKSFTGKGKWSEDECMAIAEERKFKERYKGGKVVFGKKSPIMARCEDLGIEFDSDNAADAYAVYHTYKKIKEQDDA